MYKKLLIFSILFGHLLFAGLSKQEAISHYVYQFAIHINTPSTKPTYNIHIIDDDLSLKKTFKKTYKGQKIHKKKIVISQSINSKVPYNTDLIYISSKYSDIYEKVYRQIDGKHTFIVSESYGNKKHVMINLLYEHGKKLKFEILRANILNQELEISDKLILLGGTELDVAKLYKSTKKSLYEKEEELKKSKELAKKLKKENYKQALKLNNIKIKIKKSEAYSNSLLQDIKKIKTNFKEEEQLYLKQKIVITRQLEEKDLLKEKLDKLNTTNQEVQKNLIKMQKLISEKNRNINLREEKLKKLNDEIEAKKQSLTKLEIQTKEQSKQLDTQEKTINMQEEFLSILSIATIIFLILILVIYISFKRQKKISHSLKDTISKLNETQSELIESEKMASLGKLVAGVAHELNTPIGVSITGASIVRNSTVDITEKFNNSTMKASTLKEYLRHIMEVAVSLELSLKKAAELVKSFKQVSTDQQTEEKRVFNLNEYLNVIIVGYKSKLRTSHVSVNLDLDKNIEINSYPGVYYQIFSNLINNSLIHGFEGKDGGEIFIGVTKKDESIEFIFKDNGIGVSSTNLKSIFEPFYTTKQAKGGTGLGLHIVYNLIKQKLNGSIKAFSQDGEGLTIEIVIPLDDN